jgi:hypothetical protein
MNNMSEKNENLDPITGEPKSHSVGTGVEAAAGDAAGHVIAEALNPTNSAEQGQYIDYTVMDKNDEKIGKVESVWLDSHNDPAYLAVSTGWLGMGKEVIVPTQNAHVSRTTEYIRVPYTLE